MTLQYCEESKGQQKTADKPCHRDDGFERWPAAANVDDDEEDDVEGTKGDGARELLPRCCKLDGAWSDAPGVTRIDVAITIREDEKTKRVLLLDERNGRR